MKTKTKNINFFWAELLIEELIRNGIDYFCVAPGSRSAPLAVAVAENSKAKSFVHFDERGLAFHAMAYTAASGKPSVLIATSGTAAANFYPGVIEAAKKKLPLIILTADRPPELRQTGANQTIDQVGIFGKYVRFQVDLPCPTKEITPEYVLTTIDQAVHLAKGQLPGPVHINCMYREPLNPHTADENLASYSQKIKKWLTSPKPFTQYFSSQKTLSEAATQEAVQAINKMNNGIIVVGKLANSQQQEAVFRIAEKLNWPIFPDVTSGLRLGNKDKHVIHHFDQLLLNDKLRDSLRVDGVLHLGGRMTSKRWYDFIEKIQPQNYITVLNHPLRNDPLHCVSLRLEVPVDEFCQKVEGRLKSRKDGKLLAKLHKLSNDLSRELDKFFVKTNILSEPKVANTISQLIPANSALFLASSLPIREMDMYASGQGNSVLIGSNRGTSGIDGTVASAVGFSVGSGKRATLLIGDLALLHDLNSLSMLKEVPQPITIVVINNNGGGIFSFLPIGQYEQKKFERFFGTPHGLSFSQAAKMFGLEYSVVKTSAEFEQAYKKGIAVKKSTVIEVTTHRDENVVFQQKLQKHLRDFIDSVIN